MQTISKFRRSVAVTVGWAVPLRLRPTPSRVPTIHLRGYVMVAVLLLTIVSTASAKYGGGSGTAEDPYQIATAADLIALGETPTDYNKHFILTADIDLDPNLPGRKVFDKPAIAHDTNMVYIGEFIRAPPRQEVDMQCTDFLKACQCTVHF